MHKFNSPLQYDSPSLDDSVANSNHLYDDELAAENPELFSKPSLLFVLSAGKKSFRSISFKYFFFQVVLVLVSCVMLLGLA